MASRNPQDLSLEEKASLTSGSDTWLSTAVEGFVPTITLSDGPHGVRRQSSSGDNLGIGDSIPAVCFPPATGLAATWNRALVRSVGVELAREASALDVQVILGPGLNIKRSPLGGRNFEYFSEDPYLTGRLAASMVSGIQSQGVAATPKHFAVNNQESDRMRVSADVSERALREIYLSAFEYVVKESKPWALMSSYNRVNGEFASESYRLLTQILRTEWGFDGLVMSDWGAVVDRVASVRAGLDLEMPPTHTDQRIIDAVLDGTLDPAVLEQVALRVRDLVERTDRPALERNPEEAQSAALDAAREAITLLRNQDNILPLGEHSGRVLVVGEFARTPRFQGGGSSRVVPTRLTTALEALQSQLGTQDGSQVEFSAGFTTSGDPNPALADAAVEASAQADVVLAFLGLPDSYESEGFDRKSLSLPAEQLELLDRLIATDVPVVVVLSNGSVVDVAPWHNRVGAIVECWLLGQEGGLATAEVLTGRTNPSGRLAETFPLALSDSPSYLTFPGADGVVSYGEDIFVGYRGYDARQTPVAYPFGHGLSYTTFDYSDFGVRQDGASAWTITVTITNTGTRAGAEVVQLYVGAVEPKIAKAVRELRGFEKVRLEPGQSTAVEFSLSAADLSRWNTRAMRWQLDAGSYRVSVGSSSRNLHFEESIVSEGDGVIDPLRTDSTVSEWLANPVSRAVIQELNSKVPAETLERAPEMAAMIAELPVMKLTTFGFGITEEGILDIIKQANQSLKEA